MITYLLTLAGFTILIYGAKLLVDGASSIGIRAGLPQLIIGLSIVALGTSLPELVINVYASINKQTDLAIGNVLGSNIMNTLLIVGITAIIYPIKVNSAICKRDTWINLIAILLMAILANDMIFGRQDNQLDRVDGIILLIFFGLLLYVLFNKSNSQPADEISDIKKLSIFKSILFVALGALGLFFGGRWIVDGASTIAEDFGVSQSTIGLTLIAAATSLPELVTSVVAALKKNTDIALGNALGSNVFNIFLVLGTSAVITPIKFDQELNVEIGILLLASTFLMAVIRIGKLKRTITRIEGIVLTLGYLFFILWMIF